MRCVWIIIAVMAFFAAPAVGEVTQLPRRESLVQAWTRKPGDGPEDIEGRVVLVCFVRDVASANVTHLSEFVSELGVDAGDERPASVVVFAGIEESREAVSRVHQQSATAIVAVEEHGGPLSEGLRRAGIDGDAVLVFARSGRVAYASAVTGENRGDVRREALRTVADQLGSAEIEVQARLPNGEPAEGFRVSGVSRAARRSERGLHTDEDGACYVGSLFGPPVTVFVFDQASGLSGCGRVEREGLASVHVRLQEREAVDGAVVCKTGDPVRGARVQVEFSPRVDGRFAPHRVGAGEARADDAGRFEISWLPEDIYASFEVSADGWWPESVRGVLAGAGEETLLNPVVLYPADQTLDFVLLDLDGEPLPGARCRIGRHTLRSDEAGRFTLEGVPAKPLRARLDLQGMFSVTVRLAPGLDTLAVATSPQVAAVKDRLGTRQGAPPWKVEEWVSGEPIEPQDAEGDWLVVALLPRHIEPNDRDALLRAMRQWSRAHREAGLRVVALLPCGTPTESAKEIAARFVGVSVAVDAPLGSAALGNWASPPGYTEALWRGWGRWETICFVQEPSGRAEAVRDHGDVSRVIERVQERLGSIERVVPRAAARD